MSAAKAAVKKPDWVSQLWENCTAFVLHSDNILNELIEHMWVRNYRQLLKLAD